MLNSTFFVYIISIFLVCSSLMVIISSHAIFSLLFLVCSFLLSSIIIFLLECEFLAFLFIIIYVGAIAILFLFAIMMLETKLYNLNKNIFNYFPIGLIFGGIFLFFLLNPLYNFKIKDYFNNLFYSHDFTNWYDLLDLMNDIEVCGQVLYSIFVLPLLIVGLILLVVLVGVVYLTNFFTIKAKFSDQSIFKQLSRTSQIFF